MSHPARRPIAPDERAATTTEPRVEHFVGVAAALPPTWSEAYCARCACAPERFVRRIFWAALHLHALPLAPLLLLTGHFAVDCELIASCARARSMHQIREEIEEHYYHPLNRGWLRRRLGLRVSTQRLRRLAREYLPRANLPPPIGR